jgi:hypothetical protein
VPPEELLPQIVSSMAANYAGHGTMNDIRYFGAYIQNWHYYLTNSNFDRMGYVNSAADVAQSTWRMHYYDIGQNNMKLIEWAAEEKKWDYVGAGKAIFAWSWLTLTDIYGDVILEEAFNTDLITFHYDTQDEVYAYVKQLCFEALENLNKTGDNVGNLAAGDAYFLGGDVNKWKKFTYGILARVYNRYSNKGAQYKPDSVIYYADLAMTSNADNAMVKFEANTVGATNNFFGPYRGNLASASNLTPTAIRQGAYIANLMSGKNDTAFTLVEDPRAIYMLRLNANNTFKGVEPNKGQAALAANDRPESFWGIPQITASNAAPSNDNNIRYIFRNSAPFPIMTAAEMKFLKAEAAFKKANKTLALQAYKEGISLNFDMLTTTFNQNIPAGREITVTTKENYINNAAVVPVAASGLTLRHIMLQKYIALFGFGVMETWVDMRRYHYVDLDPEVPGQIYAAFKVPSGTTDLFQDNNGKPIYRYYPRFNSEYVWNRNELERIGATVSDYHTKPTWFATN